MSIFDCFRLDGKVGVITGGGTGLGFNMAEVLAEAGADVVLVGRRKDVVEKAAEELSRFGHRTLSISGDVSEEQDVKKIVARTISEFGCLDIVIANAGGGGHEGGLPDLETWQAKIDSHLTGTYLTVKEVAPVMIQQKKGKIITIASMRGITGDIWGENPAYSCAKAGIINLTKSIAVHLAPHGIHVNCIAPGPFNTERVGRVFESEKDEHKRLAAGYLERIAFHRLGKPEEIKGLALFLASSASEYITGVTIPIDGGYLAH